MLNGQSIAAQPLAQAGLRRALGEVQGPRPGGVRGDGRAPVAEESRTARATRP